MKIDFKETNGKIEAVIEISENTKIVKIVTKEEGFSAYQSLKTALQKVARRIS